MRHKQRASQLKCDNARVQVSNASMSAHCMWVTSDQLTQSSQKSQPKRHQ